MNWKTVSMQKGINDGSVEAYQLQQSIPNPQKGSDDLVTAQVRPYAGDTDWHAIVMWGTKIAPIGTNPSQVETRFKTLEEAQKWCEEQIELGHPSQRQNASPNSTSSF